VVVLRDGTVAGQLAGGAVTEDRIMDVIAGDGAGDPSGEERHG